MGNTGVISSGDVQWMTAGSGIIHQEMPKGDADGKMYGFQLWANLPAEQKMMAPRYRDISADQIPEVKLADGASVKIIAGQMEGCRGPMEDIVIDPEYLDVTMPAHSAFTHATKQGHTFFSYVIDGQGYFTPEEDQPFDNGTVILFDDGEEISVVTKEKMVRFLLISGRPLGEPVAWRGPIVMNTQEELETAFAEYREGTFLKHKDTD